MITASPYRQIKIVAEECCKVKTPYPSTSPRPSPFIVRENTRDNETVYAQCMCTSTPRFSVGAHLNLGRFRLFKN